MAFTETLENFPILAAEQLSLLSLEGSLAISRTTAPTRQGEERGEKKPFETYGRNRSGTAT